MQGLNAARDLYLPEQKETLVQNPIMRFIYK
jgi:hypothetical protein